jgi:hypothetical protein
VSCTESAAGLLLHPHDHRRAGVEAGVAALEGGGERHLGHLLEQQRRALGAAQRHAAQVLQPRGAADVADQHLPAVALQEAAAAVAGKVAQRGLQRLELHPSCAMRAGSGSTRNWRSSPPIGITCATPGIDSSRGRST